MINGQDPIQGFVLATLHKRVYAFIIDILMIYLASFSFVFGLSLGKVLDLTSSWLIFVSLFFSIIYFTFFYYNGEGQTIGDRTFGIKVISPNNSKLNFFRSLLRAGLVSTIVAPIGFAVILAITYLIITVINLSSFPTKDTKQTFWDFVSRTYVVEGGVKIDFRKWI